MMVNAGDLSSSRIVYLTDVTRPRIVPGDVQNLGRRQFAGRLA
jgi:hypothetical protein